MKLAIEIDGATHETNEEVSYDINRQKYLENLGVKMLRYMNVDIKENFEAVLVDIMKIINLKY